MHAPPIHISTLDAAQLATLIDLVQGTRFADAADMLEAELARAATVDPERLPGDVVTMGSRVIFADEHTGERRDVVLVYPWQADIEARRVSILTPIGTALIGLKKGDAITWPVPRRGHRTIRVLDVHQPADSSPDQMSA